MWVAVLPGLSKIRLDCCFGPQVLFRAVGHDLSVHDVTHTGEQCNDEQFLQHVGLRGLEPLASSLSGKRSNRLSYRPVFAGKDYKVIPSLHESGSLPHNSPNGA